MDKNWRISPAVQFAKRQIGRLLTSITTEKFIFVATTGRSGSKTLYYLCQYIPRCVSLHEGYPEMNGSLIDDYNNGKKKPTIDTFYDFKLPAIYKKSINQKFYIETNHTFIKCFADEAVKEFGKKIIVIHLRRDKYQVSSSWYHRGSIPGHPIKGKWLLSPNAQENILNYAELLSAAHLQDHDYLKCLWYWYETEARITRFKYQYPTVVTYFLDTQDFNNPEKLLAFFKDVFGKFDTTELLPKIGSKINSSPHQTYIPDEIFNDVKAFNSVCELALDSLKATFGK